ncbi:MAG: hypothetical protein NVS4B12_16490 [Ktedonobacteraceae bacterium]
MKRTFKTVDYDQALEGGNVEYLILSLNDTIHYVRIYRRHLNKELEVYDMRHVA